MNGKRWVLFATLLRFSFDIAIVFQVTEAVHAKKSFIYCQLWALGRSANASQLAKENLADAFAAPSPIAASDSTSPRELTISETREFVQLYATAASNAIEAGFDGVEVHGANGYLIDQFLQDVTNKRTDEYGGTVTNRVRFAQEVVDAVVKRIGAKRTAIRVSPWGRFGGLYRPRFYRLHSSFCFVPRYAHAGPNTHIFPPY
jgi:NADPH2 dehydrogenase